MRRLFNAVVLAATVIVLAAGSTLASGPNSRLRCFTDDANLATCTLVANNSAHLDSTGGGYAGVYVNAKRTNGKTLDRVDFSFYWSGQPNGGAPRFSLPIDENGDGETENYAFLDAINCAGGTVTTNGTVSTESASCPVFYGPFTYPNWDAFAAANPTWTISDAIPFVIVDVPADVIVSDVSFAVS